MQICLVKRSNTTLDIILLPSQYKMTSHKLTLVATWLEPCLEGLILPREICTAHCSARGLESVQPLLQQYVVRRSVGLHRNRASPRLRPRPPARPAVSITVSAIANKEERRPRRSGGDSNLSPSQRRD